MIEFFALRFRLNASYRINRPEIIIPQRVEDMAECQALTVVHCEGRYSGEPAVPKGIPQPVLTITLGRIVTDDVIDKDNFLSSGNVQNKLSKTRAKGGCGCNLLGEPTLPANTTRCLRRSRRKIEKRPNADQERDYPFDHEQPPPPFQSSFSS